MDKPLKHSYTVGPRGPVLHEDTKLHETLGSFVNSPNPMRKVHTKGFGALGYFEVYHSMKQFTKAPFLQQAGRRIPTMTRFSLAVSNPGTPDSSRNVRGFSTKFYLEDGVFDLLCNHVPVFSVRDGIRFPDSILALSPDPKTGLADPNRFWNFYVNAPEATHFITWLFSDYGTIKSLRHLRASSVNTYVWRNEKGDTKYVKYHWLPMAGVEYITNEESMKLAGENPDIAGQDLHDTLAKGEHVEYELCVQLMDPCDEENLPYDPLDCTKTWDESDYPLMEVGKLVLVKNPANYGEQVEKVAFSPTNLQPGIELSNDKMLQGRATVYWDAQRHRLGNDFRKIPVNQQAHFDPAKLVTSGLGDRTAGIQERAEIPKTDDFTQAGERYESLSPVEQAHLVDNIASQLILVNQDASNAALDYFMKASADFGRAVMARMQELCR